MLDTLDRVHAQVCGRIHRVAAGEQGRRALEAIAAQLRSLAVAESAVLYPAFSKLSLRPETQALLDDSRDHRAVQLAAVDELARTRRVQLRKLRALRLCALVEQDAKRHATQLIAVLRCRLPRPMYQALGRAFAAHVAEHAGHGSSPDVPMRRGRAA